MNIYAIIGANIKKVRELNGMSQEQLAGKIPLHANYVARVERGESKPSIDTLVRIAKALEVAPYSLLMPIKEEIPLN